MSILINDLERIGANAIVAAKVIQKGNPVKDFLTDYEVQEILSFAADVIAEFEIEYLYDSIYLEDR